MKIQQPLKTPLLPYFDYEAILGKKTIFLKAENLQPFGSYKIRGITSVFANSSKEQLSLGVSAASAGNMGQVIAAMAKGKQLPCTIYIPQSTPSVKKSRMQRLGASLIELPFDELWSKVANPPTDRDGPLFIHPFYNEDLIKGYQTLAAELLSDCPEVDAIIIPFGVGGLCRAIAQYIKQHQPNVALYVCEPETASPMHTALTQGQPTKVSRRPSFVDAIGTPEVLPAVFDYLAPMLEGSIVVSLDETKAALADALYHSKLLCEGAGACALAAAKKLAEKSDHQTIITILSGGNIDTAYLPLKLPTV